VYYQFVHAIKGMGEACLAFDTPVTGGNVSFYNQNPDGAVYPTPTIGMVGLLEDVDARMTLDFKQKGDVICLLGKLTDDIASSEYLHKIKGVEYSPAPHFDLQDEVNLQRTVAMLIREGRISSAHDVSEGGLFITLLESAMPRGLGFSASVDSPFRKDAIWFGESQSRVVVSVPADAYSAFESVVVSTGTPMQRIGEVTDGGIRVDHTGWGNVADWKLRYDTAIERHLQGYQSE
jgi:phosphoribosylformylglycinamidine synthase